MSGRLVATALVLGCVLRLLALRWHEHPRGDVLLDVGVTRSLAQGEGFRSGFERGTSLALDDRPPPPRDVADQHAPLWPLLGVALAWPAGSAFAGLKLGSLLCGLLLLVLVWSVATALVAERPAGPAPPRSLPGLAVALVALSFLLSDFSGNGSLYMAQACLVLLVVRLLAAERPSWPLLGLTLGAALLLNHQALVLLPVPLVVLLATAPAGGRARAAAAGAGAAALALLLFLPWALRNEQVFGSPFFSANVFYPLSRAGVAPAFGLEDGVPVARFAPPPFLSWWPTAEKTWMPRNALYLFATGLLLWPGIGALVASGALPLLAAAWKRRERGVLAALAGVAALLAIALTWPDLKLRYLVPVTPLVVVLGARLLARPPTRGERWGAWALVALWLAAVLGTLDDVTGGAAQPRPERWATLAGGGAVLLALPLLLRHRAWGVEGLRLAVCSGALVLPVIAFVALLPAPHTTYHSSPLTPDYYGQLKDREEARAALTLGLARERALDEGSALVVAPVEMLAWDAPALVSEPLGGGLAAGDEALGALLAARPVDHVFVFAGEGWPEALRPGERWLDGRLEVVASWPEPGRADQAAGMLSRVVPRR
jgi:hypothetical protein